LRFGKSIRDPRPASRSTLLISARPGGLLLLRLAPDRVPSEPCERRISTVRKGWKWPARVVDRPSPPCLFHRPATSTSVAAQEQRGRQPRPDCPPDVSTDTSSLVRAFHRNLLNTSPPCGASWMLGSQRRFQQIGAPHGCGPVPFRRGRRRLHHAGSGPGSRAKTQKVLQDRFDRTCYRARAPSAPTPGMRWANGNTNPALRPRSGKPATCSESPASGKSRRATRTGWSVASGRSFSAGLGAESRETSSNGPVQWGAVEACRPVRDRRRSGRPAVRGVVSRQRACSGLLGRSTPPFTGGVGWPAGAGSTVPLPSVGGSRCLVLGPGRPPPWVIGQGEEAWNPQPFV